MNKIPYLTLLILTINLGYSQKNNLKASALIGNLGVQYERSLNSHFSAIGQIGYSMMRISLANYYSTTSITSNGYAYYIEGRYYFSSEQTLMEGWHIGPYYSSLNTSLKENREVKSNLTSLGINAGYQWQTDSGVSLGLNFGGGNLNYTSDIKDSELFLEDLNFMPHLGFNLGYNF